MTSFGGLLHFSIPVSNIDAGARFYGALFGWKFVRMTPTYWLVEGGPGSLSLERGPISGTMPILYFSVSDIGESLKVAAELGGQRVLEKMGSGDGSGFFATFRDPDGNVIGLWSKT